jgi:hypothetical protein
MGRFCTLSFLCSTMSFEIFFCPAYRIGEHHSLTINHHSPCHHRSFFQLNLCEMRLWRYNKIDSQENLGKWLNSGILRRVVWYKFTDVSEVFTAFIISRARLAHCPGNEGSKHLWNVGKLLPDYMAHYPRRYFHTPLYDSLNFTNGIDVVSYYRKGQEAKSVLNNLLLLH